jgi:signal transduction histidine kinase
MSRVWRDLWPVLVILVPGLGGTRNASEDQLEWSREPDLFAYALVVFAALSAVMLRRKPGVTLACCGAAVVTYLLMGYAFGPMLIAVPVAAAGVALAWPLRKALLWNGLLGVAVHVAGSIRFGSELSEGQGLPFLGWVGASFTAVAVPTAIGAAVRIRRESEAGVREAQARRAVSEERLRMAQELHDSVGHGLAVIAMQAGVALHVLERNPDKARETLEAIRDASKNSLDSLRAELHLLRAPENDDAPRRPEVGMADVDTLFDRIRRGGLDVDADVQAGSLPPELDVAAYHIVQESLTNVLRHSSAGVARVRVAWAGGDLQIEVADNGREGSAGRFMASGDGMGIPGMRARAQALGGDLSAGPGPEEGFVVRARLPRPAEPRTADEPAGTKPTDVQGSA